MNEEVKVEGQDKAETGKMIATLINTLLKFMAQDLGNKLKAEVQKQIEEAFLKRETDLKIIVQDIVTENLADKVSDVITAMIDDGDLSDKLKGFVANEVDTVLDDALDDSRRLKGIMDDRVGDYITANYDFEEMVKEALDKFFDGKSFSITPEN